MQVFFFFLLTQIFTEINMRACSSQEHFFTSDRIFVSHYVLSRQHKKDGLKTSYCLQDLFSLFPQHFYFAMWSKYSVWSVNCARGFDVESLPSNVSFLFNDFCFQVDALWVISLKKKKKRWCFSWLNLSFNGGEKVRPNNWRSPLKSCFFSLAPSKTRSVLMVAVGFAATLAVRCACECLYLKTLTHRLKDVIWYCLTLGNLFSVAAVFDGGGP